MLIDGSDFLMMRESGHKGLNIIASSSNRTKTGKIIGKINPFSGSNTYVIYFQKDDFFIQ